MSVLSSCFSFSSHPLSIEVSTSKRGRGLSPSTYFPSSFFGRFAFVRLPFALHTVSWSRSLVTTDRVSEVILVEFVGPASVGNAFDTIQAKRLISAVYGIGWWPLSRNRIVGVNGPRGTARYIGQGTYLRGPVGGWVEKIKIKDTHTHKTCLRLLYNNGDAVRDARFCPGCRHVFGLGGRPRSA